jgi:hypothetical protein
MTRAAESALLLVFRGSQVLGRRRAEGYGKCRGAVAGNGQKVAGISRTMSATAFGYTTMVLLERR